MLICAFLDTDSTLSTADCAAVTIVAGSECGIEGVGKAEDSDSCGAKFG